MPAQRKSDRGVSYIEAAMTVLERVGRPLTTTEILEAALEEGLIVPTGKTPRATLSAALYERAKWDKRLVKRQKPGESRAIRGSVRWTVRPSARTSR